VTKTDPARKPEDTDTTTDPQVGEDGAETPEEAPEAQAEGDQGTEEETQEAETETETPDAPTAPADGKGVATKEEEDQGEFELVVEGSAPSPAPKDAAAWARLRKEAAAAKAEASELKRKLDSQGQVATAPNPGEKPTLESCDYNPEVFEAKLDAWKTAVAQKAQADQAATIAAQKAQETWAQRRSVYSRSKEELARQLPAYEELETVVRGALNPSQQDVIIHVAENPARVVAALGQNPKLAQEFGETMDPILLASKIARLEARINVKKKTPIPPPEKKVGGSGPTSGTVDSTLDRLRAEAAKTGDLSKVNEYKRKKRQAA